MAMEKIAARIGLPAAALNDYLGASVPGFSTLTGLSKFGDGQSNPTFKVEAESGTYVLRSKPTGDLLPSAHAVDREFRVMQALAGTDVPVPTVLHLATDDASPTGRAFYVMAFLDGQVFWDPALPDMDTAGRGAVYNAMNATLAALHDVDVTAVGLSDYGKPGHYFARQLDRWSRQYTASTDDLDPAMVEIMDWLAEKMPEDDGQVSLVHGDWRIDNLMFDQAEAKIIGVLDWELSTLGHPMADLAYQCMQWRLPNKSEMRGLAGIDRERSGLPTERAYVADYARRRGLDGIEDWEFYLVFAFFRLAAILAGVAARAAAGNASNPEQAKRYAMAIPVLAGMALATMREGA